MAKTPVTVLPKRLLANRQQRASTIRISPALDEAAATDAAAVYARLNTGPGGLTSKEASARLLKYGLNVLARDHRASFGKLLWRALLNPLVLLLAALGSGRRNEASAPSWMPED